MRFRIDVASGEEVIFAGHSTQDRTVYHGAAPYTGLWRVSIPDISDFLSERLELHSYGSSIEQLIVGIDIAELESWGKFFVRLPVSYRPKSKTIFANGQIEWSVVKELPATEQFRHLSIAMVEAIEQIPKAKRKPKDFDSEAACREVQDLLRECDVARFVVDIAS